MFGERLNNILQIKNMSQVELAKELNMTAPAINRWCNNVTEPDNKTIVKIANILEVSTDYLLGNDNGNNKNDEQAKEKEALKKALKEAGFMNNDDDMTDEELDNAMKFLVNNKEFLKNK